MGLSRKEYSSGLPFLSPGDLPNPGIEPRSPALEADALPTDLPGTPIKYHITAKNTFLITHCLAINIAYKSITIIY